MTVKTNNKTRSFKCDNFAIPWTKFQHQGRLKPSNCLRCLKPVLAKSSFTTLLFYVCSCIYFEFFSRRRLKELNRFAVLRLSYVLFEQSRRERSSFADNCCWIYSNIYQSLFWNIILFVFYQRVKCMSMAMNSIRVKI